MTTADFIALTCEQRESVWRVFERTQTEGEYLIGAWPDFVESCSAPTSLSPYVGVMFAGMFLGIESDGHTHS